MKLDLALFSLVVLEGFLANFRKLFATFWSPNARIPD